MYAITWGGEKLDNDDNDDDAIIDSKDTGAREKNKYTSYKFLYF